MKTKFLAAAAACALFCGVSGTAQAQNYSCGPDYTFDDICFLPSGGLAQSSKRSETVFFTGLQWVFGAGAQSTAPQLVLGARYTETRINDRVTGAKFDVAIPLNADTYNTPTLRLLGLAGNRTAQAEAGFGLRLNGTNGATPMFVAGVQVPYANFGAQFLRGEDRPEYYVGFNTLAKLKAPESVGGALTCEDGELITLEDLLNDYGSVAAESVQVDGQTCLVELGGL